MRRHDKGMSREVSKRGMTVEVKTNGGLDAQARNLESAIKTLKRRMVQEGVVRELRSHEYFESKGLKRRKAMKEAISRANKAKRQAALRG